MGRKFIVINLLILTGVILLSRYLTAEWKSFEAQNNVQGVIDKAKAKAVHVPELEALPQPVPPQPFPDFTVIPEKDLFMAERRPPAPEAPQTKEEAPKFAKVPVLNGILNTGGQTQAMVTIFDTPNAKGQSRTLALGDVINGWTIAEIKDTSFILRWKDEEKVIDMFDSAPQQASAAPQSMARAPVTVITIGSSGNAVETVAASEPAAGAEEKPGLTVGVAGGAQQGVGQGQRGGQIGPGGSRGGMSGARGGYSRSGRVTGQSGSGMVGSSSSVPFTSGRGNQSGTQYGNPY